MISRVRIAVVSVLALTAPSVARSQQAEAAPWALFSVRYDTRTSDFIYAAYGYLPSLHRGPVWIRATSELYLPLSRTGTLQFSVSPLSTTVPIFSSVDGGVAMDVSASRGARTSIAIGPELRLALPKAVLGTDIQKVLNERASRLRIFFTTTF